MGTRFELAIVTDESTTMNCAAIGESALREIEEWHQRLTRFEPDSWLSFVNRIAAHEPVRLDDEMWPLFVDAMEVWRDSGGAFDITRGAGAALELDRDAHTLRFCAGGDERVSLDMGAIGKGHALDCAAASLRSHGVTGALLQGGTSSGVAIGRPPEASAWRIGVTSGTTGTRVDDVLELVDASFSISDEASQPDAPFGRHIVDPRVATEVAPARAARRVVVTGPSARLADAWSTALVVLGEIPPAFPAGYAARFLTK